MKLNELKGNYDAIYALGFNCLPSIQLEKNKLRPFAGVIDWMFSDLSDVSYLMQNRFEHFMERSNLQVVGYDYGESCYLVKDCRYNITSTHDFPVRSDPHQQLLTYPEFQNRVERRIKRCLEKLETSRKLLFVRTGASYEQALLFQSILSQMVTHDYRVLIVNYAEVEGVADRGWDLEKVCAVDLPQYNIWTAHDEYWREIFQGINYLA